MALELDLTDRATVQAIIDGIDRQIVPLEARKTALTEERATIEANLKQVNESLGKWRDYRQLAQRGLNNLPEAPPE